MPRYIHRRAAPLVLWSSCLLLPGCTKQHAEITGTFTAWIAADNSATAAEDDLDFSQADVFDCSTPDGMTGNVADCDAVDPDWFTWLEESPYYRFQDSLDPWRSEAIITSENDFQLTFHQDLGNGQDFRVAFVVDTDFEPSECAQGESGEAELVQVDGEDWVARWSEDEEGGLYIYYLNAGAYQYNPYDDDEYWVLPDEWLAGYGYAKFDADEFNAHPTDFGVYDVSEDLVDSGGEIENWYVSMDPDEPDWSEYEALLAEVQEGAAAWEQELVEQGGAQEDFQLKVEDNSWREPDSSSAGLDGWVQMESSWVRLDTRGTFEDGQPVSGDFQILLDGAESTSRVLVTGSFSVDQVHEDRWGYPSLEEEKEEENDTPTCE